MNETSKRDHFLPVGKKKGEKRGRHGDLTKEPYGFTNFIKEKMKLIKICNKRSIGENYR